MASSTRDVNEISKLQLRAAVNQLTCFQRARNATNEHGFAWIQRHRSVQHKISIWQAPRANLNRLILDGWRRHTDVQLLVLHDAVFNQILDRAFILHRLEQKVIWIKMWRDAYRARSSFREIFIQFPFDSASARIEFSFSHRHHRKNLPKLFVMLLRQPMERMGGKTLKWKSNNSSEAKKEENDRNSQREHDKENFRKFLSAAFVFAAAACSGGKLNERKVWQDYSTLCSTFFVCFCDSVNWGSYMCTQDDLTGRRECNMKTRLGWKIIKFYWKLLRRRQNLGKVFDFLGL